MRLARPTKEAGARGLSPCLRLYIIEVKRFTALRRKAGGGRIDIVGSAAPSHFQEFGEGRAELC